MEIEEIKSTYEERYKLKEQKINQREIDIYRKYYQLILPKEFHNPKLTMVDIGCGLGSKTIGFCEKHDKVLALDLSTEAINICQTLFQGENITFKEADILTLKDKFEIISAFGLSLFNTPNNQDFIRLIEQLIQNTFSKKGKNILLIGSFTDFSGKGKSEWYLHTKSDIQEIIQSVSQLENVRIDVFFPHRSLKNYFFGDIYNTFAELYKLLFKKRKTFFFRVVYG